MKKDTTLILGAMDIEIQEYLKHITQLKIIEWHGFSIYSGILNNRHVIIAKSGVGKVFAAMLSQHLIDAYAPNRVIFTGVAGALNPAYNIGDVVISTDCIHHDLDATALGIPRGAIPYTDYRFFEADPDLRKAAINARIKHKIYEGRILTGDQFITGSKLNSFNYLTDELKGDAIEMEGAAVAQVCTINTIPFLVVRTISDLANQHASVDFNNLLPEIANNSYLIASHILLEL